jgi:hypothetical protein
MDPQPAPAQRRLIAAVASALDADGACPDAVVETLETLCLFELFRPGNGGGIELGVRDLCLVLEELGARLCDAEALRLTHEHAIAASPTSHPDAALIGTAAALVGAGRRSHELAARRAGERVLSGRPLIERQGLAHDLARGALALDRARVGVWQAAWDLDAGDAAGHRAPAALADAAEAALRVSRSTCRVFGAAGTSASPAYAVYAYTHVLAGAHGPIDELWREAAARRFQETANAR